MAYSFTQSPANLKTKKQCTQDRYDVDYPEIIKQASTQRPIVRRNFLKPAHRSTQAVPHDKNQSSSNIFQGQNNNIHIVDESVNLGLTDELRQKGHMMHNVLNSYKNQLRGSCNSFGTNPTKSQEVELKAKTAQHKQRESMTLYGGLIEDDSHQKNQGKQIDEQQTRVTQNENTLRDNSLLNKLYSERATKVVSSSNPRHMALLRKSERMH